MIANFFEITGRDDYVDATVEDIKKFLIDVHSFEVLTGDLVGIRSEDWNRVVIINHDDFVKAKKELFPNHM